MIFSIRLRRSAIAPQHLINRKIETEVLEKTRNDLNLLCVHILASNTAAKYTITNFHLLLLEEASILYVL